MKSLSVLLTFIGSLAMADVPTVTTGKLIRIDAFESKYVPARPIDIWLPPNFDATNQYPVLYMHDGQMLFDRTTTWNGQEWGIDEVAGQLIADGLVRPFIVVGVHNIDTHRHAEYFPQQPFLAQTREDQQKAYRLERGPDTTLFSQPVYSDRYLEFLVRELKPFIEAHYPVLGAESYLMGSSMGGLISWYGLLNYPDEFRGAACLSTHWPGYFTLEDNPMPVLFEQYFRQHVSRLTYQKLYFDYGTATLDALYPDLQVRIDSVMSSANYPRELWQSQKFEGANHSEAAWSARLHIPLQFLFGDQ